MQVRQIIKKLDEIIDIARSESSQLSVAKEIILKLVPAIATSALITYLNLFSQHSWDMPTNIVAIFVYFITVPAMGIYVHTSRKRKIAKYIYTAAMIGGCVWLFVHPKAFLLPKNIFLCLLCVASIFISAMAVVFFLIDSIYTAHRNSVPFPYEEHRSLINNRLEKFELEEINSAIQDTEATSERLIKKIDYYRFFNCLPFLTLFWGLYAVFISQIFLEMDWWYYPIVIYGLIGLILLSVATIFTVTDCIICVDKSNHKFLHTIILLKYYNDLTENEIAELESVNLRLKTELDRE